MLYKIYNHVSIKIEWTEFTFVKNTFFTLVLAKQKLGLGISYACFQTK